MILSVVKSQKFKLLIVVLLNIVYTSFFAKFDPVNIQLSCCKHAFAIGRENSVDSDLIASSEASWSEFTVFSKMDKSGFSRTRVNKVFLYVQPENEYRC